MSGVQTSSLLIGGQDTVGGTAATEEYDGSTWTTVNSMNTARLGLGSGGSNSSHAVAFSGNGPDYTTVTEEWDGTNWTTLSATTANARQYVGSAGTATKSLLFGGRTSPSVNTAATEEYFSDIANYSASSQSAWASGGNVNTNRTTASAGTQTANVIFAGQLGNSPYAPQSIVEEYNGSTWTSANTYPTSVGNLSGTGTQTAALGIGGYPNVNTTAEYDGTSWSPGGALGTGRELLAGIGIQTAALVAGGYIRGSEVFTTAVEQYDGSAWTAAPSLNTGLYGRTGNGTTAAGLAAGGNPSSNVVEEYNGSSWSTVNTRPYSASTAMGSGTQTAALNYGGNPASPVTTTVSYDGTNWSSETAMTTGRSMGGGSPSGTSSSALASTGGTLATEEFTAGAPASPTGAAASTLTTS
jgi:hypothetical protein